MLRVSTYEAITFSCGLAVRQIRKTLDERDGEHFGNAREIRTLFERVLEKQADRLLQQGAHAGADLNSFKAQDFN